MKRAITQESVPGAWEMARTAPADWLRPYAREYVGWWEQSTSPVIRREVPTELVPLIINFGAPIGVLDPSSRNGWATLGSFVTGVYDRHVLVRTIGPAGGLQINLTILGARLVLGRPLGELVNLAVSLDTVFGSRAASLRDEVLNTLGWEARFQVIDRELTARIRSAHSVPPGLAWAAGQLIQTKGHIRIGALVEEVGCSQRHLVAQFKEQLGVTPKTLARVLRFGHAMSRLRTDTLTAVALDCGYYDQAHFDRDFREFAGITPTDLMRSALDSGGFAADR